LSTTSENGHLLRQASVVARMTRPVSGRRTAASSPMPKTIPALWRSNRCRIRSISSNSPMSATGDRAPASRQLANGAVDGARALFEDSRPNSRTTNEGSRRQTFQTTYRRGLQRRPRSEDDRRMPAIHTNVADVRENVKRAGGMAQRIRGIAFSPSTMTCRRRRNSSTNRPDIVLRSIKRNYTGPLNERPPYTRLSFVTSRGNRRHQRDRHDAVTHAPAGHRIRLGETVENNRPVGHTRKFRDADRGLRRTEFRSRFRRKGRVRSMLDASSRSLNVSALLSDEIYCEILYDGDHVSIAEFPGMADRTIILDGFSKAYAMTGCAWVTASCRSRWCRRFHGSLRTQSRVRRRSFNGPV